MDESPKEGAKHHLRGAGAGAGFVAFKAEKPALLTGAVLRGV